MNRQMVYPGSIPQDTDLLLTNKHGMIGLGYLIQAVLGSSTLADGLACTPTSPATMTVNLAGGSIYSLTAIDATAYGSIAADTTDLIMKQGIQIATQNFSCPAPSTSGQSVVYLIEAAYQDVDGGSTVLPYYNASNPSVPYSGPNNSGAANFTVRQGKCTLAVKTGIAATTGSQTTPTPDAGYVGLWAITVANGQTTITSGNITAAAGAPFIGTKLTGRLASSNNLSDVASASTSLANLGGLAITAARTRLTANTTFYVSPVGNDSNPGTSGLPWITIQHAINYIANSVDIAGFTCTVNVADGTYTSPVNITQPFVGGIPTLSGNATTPANCIISTTSSNCINVSGGAQVNILGFQLQAATLGSGIIVSGSGSQANITGKMAYGATAGGGSSQLYATDGGCINIQSAYSIVAGANAHWIALNGGEINGGSNAVTLTGTPAFATQFAAANNLALIQCAGMTFTGSATGTRYLANANAVIQTSGGGASFLPGSVSGSAATGGLYL